MLNLDFFGCHVKKAFGRQNSSLIGILCASKGAPKLGEMAPWCIPGVKHFEGRVGRWVCFPHLHNFFLYYFNQAFSLVLYEKGNVHFNVVILIMLCYTVRYCMIHFLIASEKYVIESISQVEESERNVCEYAL